MGKVNPPPHTQSLHCTKMHFVLTSCTYRDVNPIWHFSFFSLHHHSCRHWECLWLKQHSHHCRPNICFCQQEKPWASAGSESDISRRGCKQRRHPCGVHLHRECVAWEQRQVLCETDDYKKSLHSFNVACEKLVKESRTVLVHWS